MNESTSSIKTVVPRPGIESNAAMSEARSLSAEQKLRWFLHQLAPESPANNIAGAARSGAELDQQALRRALQGLVERHALLRASFVLSEGQPLQQILNQRAAGFEVEDASGLSDEAFGERLREAAARPFELEQETPVRLHLFRRAGDEHVLLLVLHSLVADRQTLSLLAQELTALYRAEKATEAAGASPRREGQEALPESESAYLDYARWQEETLDGQEGERLWAYWQRQLGSAVAPDLDLPTDHARPSVLDSKSSTQTLELDPDLTAQLKRLSERREVTLYTTLLAAFGLLLYRYSGQEEFLIGAPINVREQAGRAGAFGNFDNYLALKIDLSNAPTFEEFLARLNPVVSEGFAHGLYPFPQLVERLQPVRDPSRWPLFQAAFDWQDSSARAPVGQGSSTPSEARRPDELDGLLFEPLAFSSNDSPFELSLVVSEEQGRLRVSCEHRTELFEAATISRLLGHLRTMLESVVIDSQQRVSLLPLLTEQERQQILFEWNRTEVAFPSDKCLHHLLEAQAERSPDSVAVVFEEQSLTYEALNRQANQLAHHLMSLGVGPEARVATLLEPSLEMAVGCIAILKAGAAVVFLDSTYPEERLAFMLEDAEAAVLLTSEHLLEKFSQYRGRAVCVDSANSSLLGQPQTNPESGVSAENAAWLAYTSGTTGTPKGTLVPHRVLCNFGVSALQTYDLKPELRVFDLHGIFSIIMAMMCGGKVFLARRATLLSPTRLAQMLRDYEITQAALPPALLAVLEDEDLPLLRIITTGGEKLSTEVAARWSSNRQLFQNYRCTEALSGTRVECDESFIEQPNIGRPIANTQVYLLDGNLQPVPVGVPGQLCIGGAGLARGYLHEPALTAERFVPHPFSDEQGARLYLTGDLARFLADGRIEFVGRLDHQVNIRGFRVELGEIETLLAQHPSIKEAVVIVREDVPGDKRLVAYVVALPGSAPTISELHAHLKKKLPAYMMPAAFMLMAGLPLTPHRKVDRRALPPPEQERPELEGNYVAPSTLVEETLAAIWSEVLGVKPIGIHDNFFELGGHSLLATQVMSRVRDAYYVEIPLRRLFEGPTVAELAITIVQAQAEQTDDEEMLRLLADLDQLSESEAQRLRADEREPSTHWRDEARSIE